MTGTDLLTLTQWLSPAFPVGGYAYSHGLETAIAKGDVADADGLQCWLEDVLDLGAGRTDAILLAASLNDTHAFSDLCNLAAALSPSRERWAETMEQGRAFGSGVAALTESDVPDAPLPLAVGRAARQLSLPAGTVAGLYLHAFASNLVSGAVRFIPLGQTEGQRVLAALHPLIDRIAGEAVATPLDQIANTVPGADIAAMAHETLDVRIFKT